MATDSWRKTLLPATATLHQAIVCLDENSLQIVIIVAEDGRLLGTLTDGDIRRGLLRGLEMSSLVESIIHRDPVVVPPQQGARITLPPQATSTQTQAGGGVGKGGDQECAIK